MVTLIGESKLKNLLKATLEKRPEDNRTYLIDDRSQMDFAQSPWHKLTPEWLERLIRRDRFRELCAQENILSPKGDLANSFDELSKLVIKYDSFPLALKSRVNGSDGVGTFRLEGFRELPKFYDLIQSKFPGPVWLENWINPEARIEVSRGPNGFSLVVQVGLDASLQTRAAWRMFPVSLPTAYKLSFEKILASFQPLLEQKSLLVRFSIGLKKGETWLLSVNSGYNRLEYFAEWCSPLGLSEIPLYPQSGNQEGGNYPEYGRIQFFYRKNKRLVWAQDSLENAKGVSLLRSQTDGKILTALLGGNSPKELDNQVKILSHYLETKESPPKQPLASS